MRQFFPRSLLACGVPVILMGVLMVGALKGTEPADDSHSPSSSSEATADPPGTLATEPAEQATAQVSEAEAAIEASIFQGAPNVLSREQLDRLTFHTEVIDFDEASERHLIDELAIDLFMPATEVPVGEPVYAYFVAKNRHEDGGRVGPSSVQVDLQYATENAWYWNVRLRRLVDGAFVRVEPEQILHVIEPLQAFSPWSYCCTRGDLRQRGELPPGRYQIDWSYSGNDYSARRGADQTPEMIRSRTLEFTVTPSATTAPSLIAAPSLPFVRLFEMEQFYPDLQAASSFPTDERAADGLIVFDSVKLIDHWDDSGLVTALTTGAAGDYYPDPNDLPSEDRLLQATAQFEPRDDGGVPNEVSMTLALSPLAMESLPISIHSDFATLYMMLEGSVGTSISNEGLEDYLSMEWAGSAEWVEIDADHPLEIRIQLPDDWYQQSGIEGTCQVRLILCSDRNLSFRSSVRNMSRELAVIRPDPQDRTPWFGLLSAPAIELELSSLATADQGESGND